MQQWMRMQKKSLDRWLKLYSIDGTVYTYSYKVICTWEYFILLNLQLYVISLVFRADAEHALPKSEFGTILCSILARNVQLPTVIDRFIARLVICKQFYTNLIFQCAKIKAAIFLPCKCWTWSHSSEGLRIRLILWYAPVLAKLKLSIAYKLSIALPRISLFKS